MRFTRILGLLIQASIFQGAISAPVTEVYERGLVKRYTGEPSPKKGEGPDTSDYPSDEDIRAAHTSPTGAAVFFSGIPDEEGGSTKAYEFAKSIGGYIFRQAYPKGYTNRNKRSLAWYQNFADRFSGVFAEKATDTVYLVAPFDKEPDECRVWTRIEFPTLQDNVNVKNVIKVDYKDFSNRKAILGDLPGGSAASAVSKVSAEPTTNKLHKRQLTTCLDWDGEDSDPNDV